MRKTEIFAAWAVVVVLPACQFFTAGEPVSEPDLAEARAKRSAAGAKAAAPDSPHGRAGSNPHARAKEMAPESATASHILIRYTGAMRSPPDITRSKAEAQALAEKIAAQAQAPGADFAALADQHTEDPSGKGRGGRLGTFGRGRMVPPFDQATFALAPGDVSEVVETAFGFHIIYREK
jgi:hypothetical protein